MGNYYYLISTLPLLRLGEPPPLSLEKFHETCGSWLPARDLTRIKALRLEPPAKGQTVPSAKVQTRWLEWESSLRNGLVKIRAAHLDREPEKSLRPVPVDLEAERGAREAFTITDPLQREKALDQSRWLRLEEFEFMHDFDFQRLCVYKIKLLLCHKWVPRTLEKGKMNLEAALGELQKGLQLL